MANPRLDAILGQLSQGAPEGAMMEEAPMESPIAEALALLEPLAEGDARIAQVVSMLQEISGGPSEVPEDAMAEAPELPPA